MSEKSLNSDPHGIEQQIPRNSLILIMLAQAAVVIPHVQQLSPWIIIFGLVCAIWRWLIFQDRLRFPSWQLKGIIALATSILIVATEGLQHRLETWTSFLIVVFALKLVETKRRRDAYAVIFLAFFIIATEFIYSQTILISLYELFALIIVTAAMVGMNQFHTRINLFSSASLATKLIAQSLPLTLVLFVFFPRVTPFWTVPTASTARTGLSSEMTPGEIALLTRSDEIAFRAVFRDALPQPNELYWRGLVFSNYSNGTWSLGNIPFNKRLSYLVDWANDDITRSFVPNVNGLEKISYQILQEPTDKVWQFGLDLAIPKRSESGLTWDFRIVSEHPISTLTQYSINSYPDAILDHTLPSWLRKRETRLPSEDNPRVIRYAKKRYAESKTDRQFITEILKEIRSQNFRYTLQPPTLPPRNSIDQFWFDTQAGFCMHYAGALTYILRAVDIPARVVGGYQGGEVNPVTGHVVVRQYHAHAWVEAWLPGQGWQRFDPTAAIAPERIELGLEAAIDENERDTLSAFTNVRLGRMRIAAQLMYLFESFEHRWNMFVVGYDSSRQYDTLQKLLGKITVWRVGLILLAGAGISLALAGLSIFLTRRKVVAHPAVKLFQSFCGSLRDSGFNRNPQESPMQFVQRICKTKGVKESNYMPVIRHLQKILYNSSADVEKNQIKALKAELANLRYRLISA